MISTSPIRRALAFTFFTLILLTTLPGRPVLGSTSPPVQPPTDPKTDPLISCEWCELRATGGNCWALLSSPLLNWDLRKNCEVRYHCYQAFGPGGIVIYYCGWICRGEKCYIV